MIVQQLADGRTLCINQTSHALMAAALCRHWGNDAFAVPTPYEPVMMAIAQHDNGWYEWEEAPLLRPDGFPMDFMHGPAADAKAALWALGIARAAAQHPYAGLLVRRHATLLYASALERLDEGAERTTAQAFVARWPAALDAVRARLGDRLTLTDAAIDAHTRLLQFGDNASLQVCVPWSRERQMPLCPVDEQGTYAEITMRYTDTAITFDPWPFDVARFDVSIHGRVLATQRFANDEAYRAALAEAPTMLLSWVVQPA